MHVVLCTSREIVVAYTPQRVVEILVDPVAACVTITGEHGSGKTERAIQACDYVRMRHHFDSVLWADVKKAVGDATAVSPNMWAVYDDPCRLVSARQRFFSDKRWMEMRVFSKGSVEQTRGGRGESFNIPDEKALPYRISEMSYRISEMYFCALLLYRGSVVALYRGCSDWDAGVGTEYVGTIGMLYPILSRGLFSHLPRRCP